MRTHPGARRAAIDTAMSRDRGRLLGLWSRWQAALGKGQGVAQAQVTYDSADQPYASITAQQDAQDRAAAECARKIQMELAAWLATQGKS